MDTIIVGRLGRVYGVRGWFHINSFTKPIDTICQYQEWQIKHLNHWQTMHVEAIKPHGRGIIAKLAEIDDREIARTYTNDVIAVKKEHLPDLPENEYYEFQLIGLSVVNLEGKDLGVVDHLMATGANDVIVTQLDQREILIPYVDAIVKSVDLERKIITVDWDPF